MAEPSEARIREFHNQQEAEIHGETFGRPVYHDGGFRRDGTAWFWVPENDAGQQELDDLAIPKLEDL